METKRVIGTQRATHLTFSPAVKRKHARTGQAIQRPALTQLAKHIKER